MFDGDEKSGGRGARLAPETCAILSRCRGGVLCADAAGIVTHANSAACRLLARAAGRLVGRPLDAVLDEFRSMAAAVLPLCTADGDGLPVSDGADPLRCADGCGGTVVLLRDAQASSRHPAHHDLLTGLPNHRLLSERLDAEMSRAARHGGACALHLVDVADYAALGDEGSAAGEQLVLRLAERLRGAVRLADTVARVAPDRFAVIQVGVDRAGEAAAFARQLCAAGGQPVCLDGRRISPALRVGVAVPAAGSDETDLAAAAEAALYRAKAAGKPLFVAAAGSDAALRDDARLLRDFARAIDTGGLQLLYQPQLSLDSHAVVGVEAKLRWQHPALGEADAAILLPLADRNGLAGRLGLWTVRSVCRQVRAWIDAGIPFGRVSFPVSPAQLTAPGQQASFVAAAEAQGVPWRLLEVEIDEAAYFAAGPSLLAVLDALQARGARVAIDRFGARYAPLLACRPLNVNSLKIDRQLVDGIDDAATAGRLRETIALAHALGMAVVADGVDTPAQAEALRRFRCDCCQGGLCGEATATEGVEGCFFEVCRAWPTPAGTTERAAVASPALVWSDAYATGVASIDLQHRILVDLVNAFSRQPGGALAAACAQLEEIADYADYHFRCEESFMARFGVVDAHAGAHRRLHAEGLGLIRRRLDACRDGSAGLAAVGGELVRWLAGHILAEDKALGEQIAAIGRGMAPDEAYRSTMLAAALECR